MSPETVASWTDFLGAPRYRFLEGRSPAFTGELEIPTHANYVYGYRAKFATEAPLIEQELSSKGLRRENDSIKNGSTGFTMIRRGSDLKDLEQVSVSTGRATGKAFHVDAEDVQISKEPDWITVEIITERPMGPLIEWMLITSRGDTQGR